MENNTETTMNETANDMKETEMNENATETTMNENENAADAKETKMDAKDNKLFNFNFDLNDYGFKFCTKDGDYGFQFRKDDDSNWGLAFTSPEKADATLVFEKDECVLSFTNADGEKKEMFNLTAAREWFESLGAKFTMPAQDEEPAAEATPVEAEVEAVQADAQ